MKMAKRDYYQVLGVGRDADAATIKRAYRTMAMRFHPDKNPGDACAEDAFKECSEAYAVLSDPEHRRTYDRFGHDGLNGSACPTAGSGSFEDFFRGFSDILGDIFSPADAARRCRRGADLRVEIEVSLEEAFTGTRRDVTFERLDACASCAGSGSRAGTTPEECRACVGTGRIERQQGFFMVQTACPVCRGAGSRIVERCPDCAGEGQRRVGRTLSVKIPAGIDGGMRLRVAGEGDVGPADTPRGDLAICVRIAPHASFQREGANVHLRREISFSLAALGGSLEVATLHGPQRVEIPAGTQSGTVLRLRNRGLPRMDGVGHGDQFVALAVVVPTELSREQLDAIARLEALGL